MIKQKVDTPSAQTIILMTQFDFVRIIEIECMWRTRARVYDLDIGKKLQRITAMLRKREKEI